MNRTRIQKMVLSALFLALGLLLPFLTGQIPQIGAALSPMHLPVLLCGFVCGGPWGMLVGLILPILRSLIFARPPMMPTALAMTFELAAYGLASGLLYRALPKKIPYIYVSLIGAMAIGRAVWGLASIPIYALSGASFSWQLFVAGAFLNAIPGIVLQIVVIPLLVMALRRAHLMPLEATHTA